jgi:flagella basal body P-ring formation protein FlgA
MSSAVIREDRVADAERSAVPPVVPPPKLRRRPALVAGAVVAICLGSLITGWAWTSTTHTQGVLAARETIPRGATIEASDLIRVRINADPALSPVPASRLGELVGQRAALDIAAGGLITESSTTAGVLPADGMSVVGVALTPAQAPGVALQTGDRVRVVVTPPAGAEPAAGTPQTSDAEVVGVHVDAESGATVADLLVPQAEAAVLAARVATGNIALVLDSRER